MRENYRLVTGAKDVPNNAVLVRFWREDGQMRGEIVCEACEGDMPTAPDLTLFRASLALIQHDLDGLYVMMDEPRLWRDEWGALHVD